MSPLDGRLDPVERHAAGRGDVDQPCGQARGDRVQQELDRGRSGAAADQDGRVVGVVDERLATTGVLLPGTVEAADLRTAVHAALPGVAGPEAKLRELRRGLGATAAARGRSPEGRVQVRVCTGGAISTEERLRP